MINIFIGWDDREAVAYHVLAHSLLKRSSEPLRICPIKKDQLKNLYTRQRDPYEATDFSLTRFLVPFLSEYRGYSIFMDCDMLCLTDISAVFDLVNPDNHATVVKHDYKPKHSSKMGGHIQTNYGRKNWSSFVVYNNLKCSNLTPQLINSDTGLDLHHFNRLSKVGGLPLEWNWLVGEYNPNPDAKILHYTLGGPWLEGYEETDHADLWFAEYKEMTNGSSYKQN